MARYKLVKILLIFVLLPISFQSQKTFAAQISGTLSAGYQTQSELVVDNSSGKQQVFFTVVSDKEKSAEVPTFVKVFLIGGVISEIIVLIIINFIKRRIRRYT